ncbi:MAG: Gfo/Idh/MocA family protein [Maioricimonas sp. JB049]
MSDRECRWGILGAAEIARKNWKAIWNAGNSRLVAVASRSTDRAAAYIADCQRQAAFDPVPAVCDSYEDLLGGDDIDAVYVPLPTGVRKEWVIRAAESGRHVLCEKPCAANAADLREMIDACRANGVQFMDGVMYMHSGRMPKMREVLDDGNSVGDIKRIATQFSFRAPDGFFTDNIRASADLEPLGCLGDLGWYTLRFILWTMGWQNPRKVHGRLLSSIPNDKAATPVPTEFSGELFFDGGVSASFYCSFLTEHQQWAHVSGTSGFLHVSDFVLPNCGGEVSFEVGNATYSMHGCDFVMQPGRRTVTIPEFSNSFADAQESNLFRTFADLVLTGKPDPFWSDIALQTQEIMDACLASARKEGAAVEIGG